MGMTGNAVWRSDSRIEAYQGLANLRSAKKVGVSCTHLSRVENARLNDGEYAPDDLIHQFAEALDVSEDELRTLAKCIPEPVNRRVWQKPEVCLVLATCGGATLDRSQSNRGQSPRSAAKNAKKGVRTGLKMNKFVTEIVVRNDARKR